MSQVGPAYKKFSELPASSSRAGTDLIAAEDANGNPIKHTLQQIADFIESAAIEDLNLSGATPTLQFTDTDTDDGDVSAELEASATATGTGAEDVDLAFKAQVGGTLTTFLNFDASAAKLTSNQDLRISEATPALELIDTDTDDGDVSASVTAAATATGTGAEDIDVTFAAQQGGTLTDYLKYDGSDNAVQVAPSAGQKIGFFGATPVVQPGALTQTYATADATHAARTAPGAGAGSGADGTTFSGAECDALVADQQDTAQFVNHIADQLQALGLLQ